MNGYRILIVDDDGTLCDTVGEILDIEGYDVVVGRDGEEGLRLFDDSFHLVILDICMPRMDGLSLCREIRKVSNVPIIFLTAKTQEHDKYVGFKIGGDDYVEKPFSKIELISRVAAIIRRSNYSHNTDDKENSIIIKDISIDLESSRVYKESEEIELTNIEFMLLVLLASNRGKIFSVENIYESLWNEPFDITVINKVMVHIRNLRSKIGGSKNDNYIKNIRGRGYYIEKG